MLRVTSPTPISGFSGWPGWARVGAYVAVLVVVALLAGVVAGAVFLRRPLPETDGTIRLPGLEGTVRVVRDGHGIPQVYAGTSTDLFYAQGFVQAQDRFFEMDVRRHVTAGRLAELVGEPAVASDMFIRTMGWRRVAEQEFGLLRPATKDYLRAYSAGVNAYLAGRSTTQMSAEYAALQLKGLDYKPDRWTPVDSLAWLKAMAWDLRGNMDEEIARTRLSVDRSPEQVAELYPLYDYDRYPPIVPTAGGEAPRTSPRPAPAALDALESVRRAVDAVPDLMGRGSGVGSNSWVVSGDDTVSGKPLLANDPHLDASIPGIWYQMGLHCTEVTEACPFDVSGFTFAGMPGVIIGHNADIAWGMTNLDPDVTDLFLEKVTGTTSLYDGRQEPLSRRDEVIRIAGGGSKVITVRSTRHGPLVSDVSAQLSSVGANAEVPNGSPARDNGYAVALTWTALTARPTADAVFGFDTASDWGEFRDAAKSFAVPSQNLVYADTDGTIGYQAPGAIPIRKNDRSGDYPAAGWSSANDWSGLYVPFARLPSVVNPPEDMIVTANQAVTGPDYPYELAAEPDHGYRSARIRTLLERGLRDGGKLDVSDMARVQLDNRSPVAPILVPYLMRQLMTTEYYADGQRVLNEWDFRQSADSPGAAYFNVVWSNLLRLTFHDQLPESLWPDGGARWVAVVANLLRQPNNQWWDDASTDGVIEDRDMIIGQAMRAARDELTQRSSVVPERWAWGKLHQLDLRSPTFGTSGVDLVRWIFNRGPFRVGGGDAIVDATAWDASRGYEVTSAPSMRMVVDLDDLDRSRWVNLTGESGHAASSHYRDQTTLWLAGRTLPWPSSPEALRASADHTLVLEPADSGR